jgi:hypothetical protein
MAFTKTELTSSNWTLIGNNVTDITFQNTGQYGFYINFNDSNTAPTEDVGIVYGPFQGELKTFVSGMTYKISPNYVFARSITASGSIIVETE